MRTRSAWPMIARCMRRQLPGIWGSNTPSAQSQEMMEKRLRDLGAAPNFLVWTGSIYLPALWLKRD